ncbi:MAG TPA: hypothetical protein VJP40_02685 [bacterium]|nr:hypothetical protein [bacterium]
MKQPVFRFIAAGFLTLGLLSPLSAADIKKKLSAVSPHWVADVPIPQNEKLFLVLKGSFSDKKSAEDLRRFIQQLMVKVPGDGIDSSDAYS